jgi:hypothetical protein
VRGSLWRRTDFLQRKWGYAPSVMGHLLRYEKHPITQRTESNASSHRKFFGQGQ